MGVAILAANEMRQAADQQFVEADDTRLRCLVEESRKRLECRFDASSPPQDFDYCAGAVQVCKERGTYATAHEAGEVRRAWANRSAHVRQLALLAGVILILGLAARAAIVAIRKRRNSASHPLR